MRPEFLREGTGVADFFAPPFTVLGVRTTSGRRVVRELFDPLPGEVVVDQLRTAEMLKYACNAFHAVKVAFANEIGRVLCSRRRRLARGDGDVLPGRRSSTSRRPT